jgi:hypothetical protein
VYYQKKRLLPALPAILPNPWSASKRKSAVYGLNGHRANFVIALSLGAYEHAIWKSRSFTALFSWTSALRFIKPGLKSTQKSLLASAKFGLSRIACSNIACLVHQIAAIAR